MLFGMVVVLDVGLFFFDDFLQVFLFLAEELAGDEGEELADVEPVAFGGKNVADDGAELDEADGQTCPAVDGELAACGDFDHADHADEGEVGDGLSHGAAHGLAEADFFLHDQAAPHSEGEIAEDDRRAGDEPGDHMPQALLDEGGRHGGERSGHPVLGGLFDGLPHCVIGVCWG